MIFKSVGAFLVMGCCAVVWATPGGVDRFGCHNSAGDGYHCHKMTLDKIKPHYTGETQTQRAARMKAQCRSLPNAGVCFGYSEKQPVGYGQ